MKYLFISATDFENRNLTGAHRRFIELVNSFAEHNEVYLIAYPCKFFNKDKINYIPICDRVGKKLPNHISEILTLIKYLKDHKKNITYDYAIAFGTPSAISYRAAGYQNVVVLFREDLIGYQKAVGASKLKLAYFFIQESISVKASSKIIVQCKNDKKALSDRHKGIKKKVFVQGNNINVSWINRIPEKSEVKNDKPSILFIGNFSSIRKGHQILLPAVARLLDENIRLSLYVLGDGKDFIKYKEEYSKYPAIHFEGHTNNISDYLSKADMLIVPSLIDSCPNTVLEGVKVGAAVYGSNTGGIPDLLQKQEYLFEPTVEGIYNFLKHNLNDKLYICDRIAQKDIKERLSFNWPESIENIITGG